MYYIFAVLSTVKPDVFEQTKKKKKHCGKSAICSYKLFDTVIRYMWQLITKSQSNKLHWMFFI